MTFALILALVAGADKPQVALVKVKASSDAAAVQREMREQLEPLEGCFDLALKENPSLHGLLGVSLTVEREAGVTAISATEDSLKDETLVSCALARLRFAQWPTPKKTLSISATFKFEQR